MLPFDGERKLLISNIWQLPYLTCLYMADTCNQCTQESLFLYNSNNIPRLQKKSKTNVPYYNERSNSAKLAFLTTCASSYEDSDELKCNAGFLWCTGAIFRTRSKEIVTECQNYFSLHTVGELIKKRKLQFLQKIVSSSNTVCNLFTSVAVRESELLAANTWNFGSLQRVAVSCCSLVNDNVAAAL